MISVILPTYNRERLIARAAESVLAQDEDDIELIIVDDGSTDGTEAAVAALADARVRYIKTARAGAGAARNVGIDIARGEYITFQDSDDVYMQGKLRAQREALERLSADAVFCAFEIRDAGTDALLHVFPGAGIAPGRIDRKALLAGNLMGTPALFGRAECIKSARLNERYPNLEDWELALRMADRRALYYTGDTLLRVYKQADSITADSQSLLDALRMLAKDYRADYAQSERAARNLLHMLRDAAGKCGKCAAGDCLRMLSSGQSVRENAYFAALGAYEALRFLVRH